MKKRFTVTLDAAIVKQAKIQAVKNDTNLSTLIERLLREWIDTKNNCQSVKSI